MYTALEPTCTSLSLINPSPLASENVYGTKNQAFAGSPTESRVVPVPIVGFGAPVASLPSDRILFVLCEPLSVTSQPKARRSSSCMVTWASTPLFITDPRLRVMLSDDGAAEPAMGCEMSASFVFLW